MRRQRLKNDDVYRKESMSEFFEIFFALLAVCASHQITPSPEREDLCSSLRRLAKLLGSEHGHVEDAFHSLLLEIEKEVEVTRENCEAFLASTSVDCKDVMSIYREFDNFRQGNTELLPDQVNFLIRSLLDCSFEKTALERTSATSLLPTLNDMYLKNGVKLNPVADALQGTGYRNGSIYNELQKHEGWRMEENAGNMAAIQQEYADEASYFRSSLQGRSLNLDICLSSVAVGDIKNVISTFCATDDQPLTGGSSVSLHLLCGPTGSGKTFLCNEIQSLAHSKAVHVIRPSLQFDLLGSSVGEVEDCILSMFALALSTEEKTLIILDDLEFIVGNPFAMPSPGISGAEFESHLLTRARSTLFSVFDSLPRCVNCDLLLVCTAKVNISDRIGRFDNVFTLDKPTEEERRGLVSSCTGQKQVDSTLVDGSTGKSFAELINFCDRAITAWHYNSSAKEYGYESLSDGMQVSLTMKRLLEMAPPESVRLGTLTDMVSLRIFTASELLTNTTQLLGRDMVMAKSELEALIVRPLCDGRALDNILHFRMNTPIRKPVCSGLLISGPPGCGKTSLAFHCARESAKQLPSLKLLDVSCTSLIQKEVGSSERNIHRLFATARAAAPCIVLLDGIENVAAVRGHDNTTEGTMDRVLSTLLTELDGLDNHYDSTEGAGTIAVIGLTHNASWIDPALLRPGRLEKVINLGKLEDAARFEIVEKEVEMIYGGMDQTADFVREILTQTRGMTAAQVLSYCNQTKMRRKQQLRDMP